MLKKTLVVALVSLGVMSAAYASGRHDSASHHHKTAVKATAANPVDVNTASVQALQTLPHVGPKMAVRIVKYRQQHGKFKTVDALAQVRGISAKRLSGWKGLIKVDQKTLG